MRQNRFKFKIDGEDVSPETVSVNDLFDIVKNLEGACAATARDRGAQAHEDLAVSLIGVSTGSDLLTIATSDRMFKAASTVSHAIADNDLCRLPIPAQARVRELWCKSSARDWKLSFLADGNGIANAAITPDNELVRPGAISGRTTLYGICERIGGAGKQTMQFLLPSGERLTVKIKGKELAQGIGAHLHGACGVEGEAVWDVDTWKLEEFTVDRLLDYSPSAGPQSAIESLADAADGYWDDVSPDEYVSELRAD